MVGDTTSYHQALSDVWCLIEYAQAGNCVQFAWGHLSYQ